MNGEKAPIRLNPPLTDEQVRSFIAGDRVLLTGVIFGARDAAHSRLCERIDQGMDLPIPLEGQIIYFVGPSPTRPGFPSGSAGPTTSYRMDPYSAKLIAKGLKGMIGKGGRSDEVKAAMMKYGAVYFGAIGGAGALYAKSIKAFEVIAYEELGPEALFRITVEDFPVVVINDTHGGDLYIEGRRRFSVNR